MRFRVQGWLRMMKDTRYSYYHDSIASTMDTSSHNCKSMLINQRQSSKVVPVVMTTVFIIELIRAFLLSPSYAVQVRAFPHPQSLKGCQTAQAFGYF